MRCEVILFYKDEDALADYLRKFYNVRLGTIIKQKSRWTFYDDGFSIHCIKGLSENMRGYKAHIIGVQEDLTWKENWPELRDCILRPMLMSPENIQIFDGVSRAEVERVDREG